MAVTKAPESPYRVYVTANWRRVQLAIGKPNSRRRSVASLPPTEALRVAAAVVRAVVRLTDPKAVADLGDIRERLRALNRAPDRRPDARLATRGGGGR